MISIFIGILLLPKPLFNFNTGVILLIIDIFLIIYFFCFSLKIYDNKSKVGPGDGIFGPIILLFIIIIPTSLIQFACFIKYALVKNSNLFYWGYSIRDISLLIISIEILVPFLLLTLSIVYQKDTIYHMKKYKISKFLYNQFFKNTKDSKN
tara:strand:+ start:351 stop:803 length:453 start_codon:yes stop_codon:yes gene_type:complete